MIHQDVGQPLLCFSPRAYHLPDVEKCRDTGAVVNDVTGHVLVLHRRAARQQPWKGDDVIGLIIVALRLSSLLRRAGPDAPPTVRSCPHKPVLALIDPLENSIAATPKSTAVRRPFTLYLERPTSCNCLLIRRYQWSEHGSELLAIPSGVVPSGVCHSDGIAHGVRPIASNDSLEALIEGPSASCRAHGSDHPSRAWSCWGCPTKEAGRDCAVQQLLCDRDHPPQLSEGRSLELTEAGRRQFP
mmetsp:Transcript_150514/g.288439  ORF Transcript_150514/g.288439 Transcript_150514/m.288439 type:complete len:243 (+) Transcript_150514:845-1573(+)